MTTLRRAARLLPILFFAHGCSEASPHGPSADAATVDAGSAVGVPEAGPAEGGSAPPAAPSDAVSAPDSGPDASGPPAAAAIPALDGEPWLVARNPDLGALTSPDQQPVDFAVWQAADGTWQLWSCIRGTKAPGQTRLFYRWEGAHLTDADWTPKGIAMEADVDLGETEGGLQAPYVIKVGDTFHMLYGDWQHICHATSRDGKTFTRVPGPSGNSGLFGDGFLVNTRDPMALAADGGFRVYYTTTSGAVYSRLTSDFASFGPEVEVAFGGSAGNGWSASECPFVARPAADGPYFLFRTQRYGADAQTSVYRSASPTDFGIDDDRFFVTHLALAAPELIHTEEGWFIAHLRSDLQGIQIAHLRW